MSQSFLGLGGREKIETAKFVVVPFPYEKTTSYKKGTKFAPNAILNASNYLETYDEELDFDIAQKFGFFTSRGAKIGSIKKEILKILSAGKIPIVIGGEHTITFDIVSAFKEFYQDISVLGFDAHGDLREKYSGTIYSHACVMRRVLSIAPLVQIGVRSISAGEVEFSKKVGHFKNIYFARNGERKFDCNEMIKKLKPKVYISFDVDVLDPSLVPATGTPEPGGLLWDQALDILKEVARQREIVGFDVVEFMPLKGLHSPDFIVAKLMYKLAGYIGKKLLPK